uniref:Uncharacterized protein n=1 Tax=Tanacetum cinerariifolium TaxID=118510 RepID=A0A6L2NGR4_TANCI|nr:hypothetical protein [Tanacetum cinerariifolium]
MRHHKAFIHNNHNHNTFNHNNHNHNHNHNRNYNQDSKNQPPAIESREQHRRGKRMAKISTVDLDVDDEEEQSRQCSVKREKVFAGTRVVCFKKHIKWDAPVPLDADDHTELFGPDKRPRPAGKPRPAEKTNSETTKSSEGSHSGSISESLYEDLRRKMQAVSSACEAKKAKKLAYVECKEFEFLMIDADGLPERKATIIRKKQEKIVAKYN